MTAGPTFIGVGAQKAATTWLHDVLAAHPDVFVSEPKELDFFTSFYNRGHEWYERHFAGTAAKARGETSPSYLWEPAAPARAHAYNPDLKIVAVLRDPVARAFSNHLHEVRKGHVAPERSFEDAEARNPVYVDQGRYATHLTRWIETFGREAVLILLAEEIAEDPATALDATYAHLGVAQGVRPARFDERRHESKTPKLARLQAALRAGGDGLRRAGLGEALERAKRFGPVARALALNQRDMRAAVAPMRPETRARLEAVFAPEVRRLAAIMQRESLPWPSWRAATAADDASAA